MKMNEKDAEQCSVSPKIVDVKFNKTCIKTVNIRTEKSALS